MSFVVIDIGCLECGYSSELRGAYVSLENAKLDWPDATLREDMTDGDWRGSGQQVIFDTSRPHVVGTSTRHGDVIQ